MSFVLRYQTSDNHVLEITALVGRDGQLHWVSRTLAELLGKKGYIKGCTVRDVTGDLLGLPYVFNRQSVIPHDVLLVRLEDAPRSVNHPERQERCHELARILRDPETSVRAACERKAHLVLYPTVIDVTRSTEEADEKTSFFYVWYEFFKQRALHELYEQPPVTFGELSQDTTLPTTNAWDAIPSGGGSSSTTTNGRLDEDAATDILDVDSLCPMAPPVPVEAPTPVEVAYDSGYGENLCAPPLSPKAPCSFNTMAATATSATTSADTNSGSNAKHLSTLPERIYVFHEGHFVTYSLDTVV